MKVVIGFDSSAASDYIFTDLLAAGFPEDTEFMIVSSTDMEGISDEVDTGLTNLSGTPPGSTWHGEISTSERNYLIAMLENANSLARQRTTELNEETHKAALRLRELFPAAAVSYKVESVNPYSAIMSRANEMDADVIVVGSQNASSLSKLFLGSVSQGVVTHAERTVRIARAQANPDPASLKVIVAYDGSDDSQHMVDAVARRQWPKDTMIRVVTVAEAKSLGVLLGRLIGLKKESGETVNEASTQQPQEALRDLAEAAAKKLEAPGITVEATAAYGDPKQLLTQMAEEWQADTIFLGAQGHQKRKGKSLGAVANALTGRARCSVEVVRKA